MTERSTTRDRHGRGRIAAEASGAAPVSPGDMRGSAGASARLDEASAESDCCLLMTRLGRASAVGLAASLSALEMHPHEFAVLKGLQEAGPMPQGRLGEALRVHPSNLVAVVDGLEADGCVVRRRDPADRRRYLLELTSRGQRRLEAAERATAQVESELLAPLAEEERRRLRAYLKRVASHACAPRAAKGGC